MKVFILCLFLSLISSILSFDVIGCYDQCSKRQEYCEQVCDGFKERRKMESCIFNCGLKKRICREDCDEGRDPINLN